MNWKFFPLKVRQSQIRTALIEARELVSDPKHWRGGAFYKGGAYCLMGAVNQASYGEPEPGDGDLWFYAGDPKHNLGDAVKKVLYETRPVGYPYRNVEGPFGLYWINDDLWSEFAVYSDPSRHQVILDWFDRAIDSVS